MIGKQKLFVMSIKCVNLFLVKSTKCLQKSRFAAKVLLRPAKMRIEQKHFALKNSETVKKFSTVTTLSNLVTKMLYEVNIKTFKQTTMP